MKKNQYLIFDYEGEVSGNCKSHGSFNEMVKGSTKIIPYEQTESELYMNIIEDIGNTFKLSALRSNNYSSIDSISISVYKLVRVRENGTTTKNFINHLKN